MVGAGRRPVLAGADGGSGGVRGFAPGTGDVEHVGPRSSQAVVPAHVHAPDAAGADRRSAAVGYRALPGHHRVTSGLSRSPASPPCSSSHSVTASLTSG